MQNLHILRVKNTIQAMNIVCFRPRLEANLNDTFIEWGVKYLLRELLGNSTRFHNVYFEPLDNNKLPDHDLFVLSGTPWIWDRCTLSAKYRDLITVLHASKAPKIALGIGACFPFGYKVKTARKALLLMPDLDSILELFSSITVRDKYAKRICNSLGIMSKLLCCPAVFAKEYVGLTHKEPKKNILFFYAPQFGLSRGVLSADFVQHYITLQVNYARTVEAEVICINKNEARTATELGLNVKLMHSPEEVAKELILAETLLSGRVHGCMFTVGMPISAALLPVDTRYLTYKYCGGKIIMAGKVSSITLRRLRCTKFNYNKEKKKWKKFLTCSLNAAGLS
jgi:hypothetical protein